ASQLWKLVRSLCFFRWSIGRRFVRPDLLCFSAGRMLALLALRSDIFFSPRQMMGVNAFLSAIIMHCIITCNKDNAIFIFAHRDSRSPSDGPVAAGCRRHRWGAMRRVWRRIWKPIAGLISRLLTELA